MDADKRITGPRSKKSFSNMTTVRSATLSDIPKIRELVIALKQHHVAVGNDINLTLEQLQEFFKQKCFTGLMLIKTPEKGKTETDADKIGCMVLLPDVSPKISSFGTDLDQFFIEEAYRKGGCGGKMLKTLCQNLAKANHSHVKIVFQSDLHLEPFYTHHGFKNITTDPPGVHLFKIDGREMLRELANKEVNGDQTNGCQSEPIVTVIPFTEIASLKESLYPPWNRSIPQAYTTEAAKKPFPPPQIVTVTKKIESTTLTLGSCTSNSVQPPKCMFTEQVSLFAWIGLRLSFFDIVGDCQLITSRVLQDRLKFWLDHSCIDIFEVEVPFLSPEGEALSKTLLQIGMEDNAVKHGFNVGLLDSPGMKKLANRPS